ncbi:MAG: hypothetical protein ACYSWU_16480 [Planctomycetota bacterium]|jgi:hypothetical protein
MDLWREAGRIEDFPKGERRPRYFPTLGKRLGEAFAAKFREQYDFIIDRLSDPDPTVVLCAYELLEAYAWEFYDHLPPGIAAIDLPVPEPVATELQGDSRFKEYTGSTIGEFLTYLQEHG